MPKTPTQDLVYRPKPTKPTAPKETMLKKGGSTGKVAKVMREFKSGELHSGKSGKVVKNPKQAIAIALSEAKLSKKGKSK